MVVQDEITGPELAPADFRIGRVVKISLAIYWANLPRNVLVAAIVYAPFYVVLFAIFGTVDSEAAKQLAGDGALIVTFFDFTVFPLLVFSTLSAATLNQLNNGSPAIGQILTDGMRFFSRVFLASLAVGLISVLGLVALIVPGLIAYTMFYLAPTLAVSEGCGALDALSRSEALTKGRRWPVFGLVVASVGFLLGGVILLGTVLGLLLALGDVDVATSPLVESIIIVLISSISAIIPAVTYHELRRVKEGGNPSDLAEVFE